MSGHISTSQRLHERLKSLIAETETGERLPAEPKLARQLGVSRATLREAMRTFEAQGFIHRKQGSGTYVIRPSHIIDSGLEVLESIETMAERIGLDVSMVDLRVERRLASESEQQALGLSPGQNVIILARVMIADDRPVAYLVDIVPDDILNLEDLESGFSGSVLDLILRQNLCPVVSSRCEIIAEPATPEIARHLGLQRGDVLLKFTAYLFTDTGRVVDYSFSHFLPGYFRFHVVRRIGEFTPSNLVANNTATITNLKNS